MAVQRLCSTQLEYISGTNPSKFRFEALGHIWFKNSGWTILPLFSVQVYAQKYSLSVKGHKPAGLHVLIISADDDEHSPNIEIMGLKGTYLPQCWVLDEVQLAEWLAKPTKWLASRNAGHGRVMPPKSTPTPETSHLARAQATFASQKVNSQRNCIESPHGPKARRLPWTQMCWNAWPNCSHHRTFRSRDGCAAYWYSWRATKLHRGRPWDSWYPSCGCRGRKCVGMRGRTALITERFGPEMDVPHTGTAGVPRKYNDGGFGPAGTPLAASLNQVLIQALIFIQRRDIVLDRQITRRSMDANVLECVAELLSSPNASVRRWTCDMLGELARHETTVPAVLSVNHCQLLLSLLRYCSDRHLGARFPHDGVDPLQGAIANMHNSEKPRSVQPGPTGYLSGIALERVASVLEEDYAFSSSSSSSFFESNLFPLCRVRYIKDLAFTYLGQSRGNLAHKGWSILPIFSLPALVPTPCATKAKIMVDWLDWVNKGKVTMILTQYSYIFGLTSSNDQRE
ncbi:hypothetical protein B0H13DRAFT_1855214 [Mycena leptocephala]|nr:hypothetical protein B0H13DRAFT_1855214 [Mycena leptocephala]